MLIHNLAQQCRALKYPKHATLLESPLGWLFLAQMIAESNSDSQMPTNLRHAAQSTKYIPPSYWEVLSAYAPTLEEITSTYHESVRNTPIYESNQLRISTDSEFSAKTIVQAQKGLEALQVARNVALEKVLAYTRRYILPDEDRSYQIFKDASFARPYTLAMFEQSLVGIAESIPHLLAHPTDIAPLNRMLKFMGKSDTPFNEQSLAEDLAWAHSLVGDSQATQQAHELYVKNLSTKQSVQKRARNYLTKLDNFKNIESLYNTLVCWLRLNEPLELLAEKTLGAQLSTRQGILEYWNHTLQKFQTHADGLSQLANQRQRDELFALESAAQNELKLPNIEYPKDIRNQLAQSALQMRTILDELPDLSDIVAKRRFRQRSEYSVYVATIPKTVMDITYANNAGSCLRVTDLLDQMQFGHRVAADLINPKLHLLGVYRCKPERRIGLARVFECKRDDGQAVIVANQINISKLCISGGKTALVSIYQHAKESIAEFAMNTGFTGAYLVASEDQFSTCRDKLSPHIFTFEPQIAVPYSDIFSPSSEGLRLSSPNSCYIIWER